MSKPSITGILFFFAFRVWAQMPPECGPDQPPADDCSDACVFCNFKGSTSTPNAQILWSGPNNFSSNLQNPGVSAPGNYTLLVTAANGCTGSTTVTVLQDIVPPGATALGDTINCLNTAAELKANSVFGQIFNWTGPNNFLSTQQNPVVSTGGVYTVAVTGPNGCTSTATVQVDQDPLAAIVTVIGGIITCSRPEIQLDLG